MLMGENVNGRKCDATPVKANRKAHFILGIKKLFMLSQFTRIAFRSSEKEMWTIDREFSFIMPLFISVKYEMNTVVTITITSEMSRCLILCFTSSFVVYHSLTIVSAHKHLNKTL